MYVIFVYILVVNHVVTSPLIEPHENNMNFDCTTPTLTIVHFGTNRHSSNVFWETVVTDIIA
jgi:hypothetical protein